MINKPNFYDQLNQIFWNIKANICDCQFLEVCWRKEIVKKIFVIFKPTICDFKN